MALLAFIGRLEVKLERAPKKRKNATIGNRINFDL
jgi:hypothetical protein